MNDFSASLGFPQGAPATGHSLPALPHGAQLRRGWEWGELSAQTCPTGTPHQVGVPPGAQLEKHTEGPEGCRVSQEMSNLKQGLLWVWVLCKGFQGIERLKNKKLHHSCMVVDSTWRLYIDPEIIFEKQRKGEKKETTLKSFW